MKPLAFRTRLTVLHTAAVACFLGVAAFAGHWALSRLVLGQLDGALLALAETEAAALQAHDGDPIRVHEFAFGTAPPQFARLDRFVQISGLDGAALARSANLGTAELPLPVPTLERVRKGDVVFETFDHFGDEPIRLAVVPISVGARRYAILVAGSLDDAYSILGAGRWLFVGLACALLAAVAFTSALFVRRALRPVDEIAARARSIGEPNLGERLPYPGRRSDELGRLVDTLNAMLGRIERGVESQRRFTADASHELRSPLSRLRAEIEIALRRPRHAAEYEEVLRSCHDEVQGLSQLTEELMTLALLDAERLREWPPVALAPIVDDAVRRLQPRGEARAIRFRLDLPVCDLVVRASPAAVRLALTNVLDNALKFSPPGGEVAVGVVREDSEAVILVSDQGPGIGGDDPAEVFDRFHRGVAGHADDVPGFGLGLAISRAAIEGQGGRIGVGNGPRGGATFRIALQLEPGSPS